jgi:hypothetical protein
MRISVLLSRGSSKVVSCSMLMMLRPYPVHILLQLACTLDGRAPMATEFVASPGNGHKSYINP